MDFFQHRYYKINKFLLSMIGQWPYQSRSKRRILLVLFIFLATSQIIPQIIAVVEFKDDPEVVIDSIPPFVIDIACGTKLANTVFNIQNMLKLLERMEIDWISWAHQPEIHVLEDYTETGRQFTIAYAVGIYVATVFVMSQPVAPKILNTLNLINNTQPVKFPFPVVYYGIDLETYYYYMLIHACICVCGIVTVIVAVDTMFIMHVQHACGLFTAVGHQLQRMAEKAPDISERQPSRDEDLAFQHLSFCIKKHNDAIEFGELLETSYTWAFFSFVGFNMLMISVSGFQTVSTVGRSPEEALRYAAFTIAELVHLFFQCFFSQRLSDHSEQIREYLSQSEWYRTSLSTRKLITIITVRTYSPCQLTAGKTMVMSLINFCSIVKTSMSYFTLLCSIQ